MMKVVIVMSMVVLGMTVGAVVTGGGEEMAGHSDSGDGCMYCAQWRWWL